MRVLVCGSRYGCEWELFEMALGQLHNVREIVHGGASGVDAMAGTWAREHGIACRVFVAQWREHGKAAGPMRNRRMLREARPDLVVAFPGGAGTRDMVRAARLAGVQVWLVSANAHRM